MSICSDLAASVGEIFKRSWTIRDGLVVPQPEDIQLGNDAVKLTGAVLYADLAESTSLVNEKSAHFAAEVYKTYLHCASKMIKQEGGIVTAFDGDRVMGVFTGKTPNTAAAKCALKINYARRADGVDEPTGSGRKLAIKGWAKIGNGLRDGEWREN